VNIWLVSYQEEVGSTSHEYHMLLSGQDFKLAEAACERMGENWWPPEKAVTSLAFLNSLLVMKDSIMLLEMAPMPGIDCSRSSCLFSSASLLMWSFISRLTASISIFKWLIIRSTESWVSISVFSRRLHSILSMPLSAPIRRTRACNFLTGADMGFH